MNKEVLINDFAIRCFRNTAARDYIHARLAYKHNLMPQFFWSSLHCLEKYSKCILLINRINHFKDKKKKSRIGHEVLFSIDKIKTHSRIDIRLEDQTVKFINRLEEFGARFRYLEVSWFTRGAEIVDLDRAVWEIRRYCQVLNHSIDINGSSKNILKENLERIHREKESKSQTYLNGGLLEKILKDRRDRSRAALIWQNLYFGSRKRNKVEVPSGVQAENAPLFLHPEIIDEISEYVHLPKPVKDGYRELWKKRLLENG